MLYRQEHNPLRQKLIPEDHGNDVPAGAPAFKKLEDLQGALQDAIALEHFTIPPYLCALYSIHERANPEAARIIRTVVVEEMLHMILAANILNAIGGKPAIRNSLPEYPKKMPFSQIGFTVNLLKFEKEAINTFLRIERPAPRMDAPPAGKFWSIGEFYEAVREALRRLDRETAGGIFTGTQKQVTNEHYYGSGGKLRSVCSLEDAELAINEIVGQGEGIDGTIEAGDDDLFNDDVEFAHYFRFNEIFHERRYRAGDQPGDAPSGDPLRVDWNAVYNMVPNPKMSMFQGRGLIEKAEQFNRIYAKLLSNIEEACNGKPEVLKEQGIPLMHAMRITAVDLMNEPIGNGGYTAGPTFEFSDCGA
ncbi:MAG: ferritin-like protein [Bryobacteraceae bacterium]